MSTEELRRLAVRAEDVEGRQAGRLDEVHARIHAARRRRAGVGAAAAAAVVLAVVAAGVAITGGTERTQDPADRRTPRPTPTERVEVPAGQSTVRPDIGSGDIRGWDLRGSRTNARPGPSGATDLSLTVETGGLGLYSGGQSEVATFCHGDPDTWWVLTLDLGGVDGERNADGSMQDGSRGAFGRCSPDDPTTVPPATGAIRPWQWDEAARAYPLRMFVSDALSPAAQRCLRGTTDVQACLDTHGLAPSADTDVTFGFGVYEHREAPIVLTVPGARFQALAMAEGVEYLIDRAVVSAKGASRLVVRLPASDRSRVVAVFRRETPAMEDCARRLGHTRPSSAQEERAQQEELQRRCVNELRLRVDGRPPSVREELAFGEPQAVVPPGGAHDVTVEVVKGDTRNVRVVVAVWEERR